MAKAKKTAKSVKSKKPAKKNVRVRDLGPKGGVVKGGGKPLLPAV